MSIHAKGPFQVTPWAGDRSVGIAGLDRVPMP